jgi:hypothetical protein
MKKGKTLRTWSSAVAFAAVMIFGALQAYAAATDHPGRELRGYCDHVLQCMSVCGEAGGTYYGLQPGGGPLCDCCAPE